MRSFLHALVWTKRHLTGAFRIELAAAKHFVNHGDTVIDIGAHGGAWTRPLAKMVGRKGHVYAFEALPYYAKTLRMTAKMLWVGPQVSILNKALSDKAGVIRMVWKDPSGKLLTGRTHVANASEQAAEMIEVEAVTLDGFLGAELAPPTSEGGKNPAPATPRITFIKADVEGLELLVLRGATATIARHRPAVYCELWEEYCARYGHAAADVFAFFAERDYAAFVMEGAAMKPTTPETYAGMGDVLFVAREKA